MGDIVDIRKPLDILKNALLDSCPSSHLNVLENWFVSLDQRLLVAQNDVTNIAYLKCECAYSLTAGVSCSYYGAINLYFER